MDDLTVIGVARAEDDRNARRDADSINQYHIDKGSTSTLSLTEDQTYKGIRGQYFVARALGIEGYWAENNYGRFTDIDIHVRSRKYGTDRTIDVKTGTIHGPLYCRVQPFLCDFYIAVRWPELRIAGWCFGPMVGEAQKRVRNNLVDWAVPRIGLKQGDVGWDEFLELVEAYPGSYRDKPWIAS